MYDFMPFGTQCAEGFLLLWMVFVYQTSINSAKITTVQQGVQGLILMPFLLVIQC